MVANQHGLHIKQGIPNPEVSPLIISQRQKSLFTIWNKSKWKFAMLRTPVEVRRNKTRPLDLWEKSIWWKIDKLV